MRKADPRPAPKPGSIPETRISRVAVRILLAFAAYLALNALWLTSGLGAAYDRVVLRAGGALALWIAHFPLGSSALNPVAVHNQGHSLVLIVALWLVMAPTPVGRRLARYAILAASVVASQIASLAIQLDLELLLRFEANAGVPLALPWEIALHRHLFRLLFAYGLQIASFLAVALSVVWTSGGSLHGLLGRMLPPTGRPDVRRRTPARGGWRRRALIAAVGGGALILVLGAAGWIREHDPRHVRAHGVVGDLFLQRGQPEQAADEYRAAIRGGSTDGRIWLRLAMIAVRRGERGEAARILDDALRVVEDEPERARIEQALAPLRRSGAG